MPKSLDVESGLSITDTMFVWAATFAAPSCRGKGVTTMPPDAPVSTAFPGPGSVETVADDASGTDFSMQRTLGVETAQTLHFA